MRKISPAKSTFRKMDFSPTTTGSAAMPQKIVVPCASLAFAAWRILWVMITWYNELEHRDLDPLYDVHIYRPRAFHMLLWIYAAITEHADTQRESNCQGLNTISVCKLLIGSPEIAVAPSISDNVQFCGHFMDGGTVLDDHGHGIFRHSALATEKKTSSRFFDNTRQRGPRDSASRSGNSYHTQANS
jgi:hypothetical protein